MHIQLAICTFFGSFTQSIARRRAPALRPRSHLDRLHSDVPGDAASCPSGFRAFARIACCLAFFKRFLGGDDRWPKLSSMSVTPPEVHMEAPNHWVVENNGRNHRSILRFHVNVDSFLIDPPYEEHVQFSCLAQSLQLRVRVPRGVAATLTGGVTRP